MSCNTCSDSSSFKRYDYGDRVRIRGVFTDPTDDNAPIDPEVVKLSYKHPSNGTITLTFGDDIEVQKESVGVYYVDLDIDAVGDWYYRWWSTGNGMGAEEGQFLIEESQFD